MIEHVIKRDGRREEFNPEKLNDWARWSEKTIRPQDFNWSSVVLRVVGALPSEVTTKELQDALIKECLDHNTWESNRMAGRLYASALSKELYETRKHPHIKDLHDKLIGLGVIVETGYTDEEYNAIDKMLNHKKDFTYPHYSINQLVRKYALQDRTERRYYETPQFIYMRVAMQTFKNYHRPDRLEKLEGLYQELSNQRINVPTPYFANSLTSHPNTSSCAVMTCTDEAESIGVLNTLAYTLTTAGAGVGAHMKTRSIGDPVRGGLVEHAGKIPYYRAFANVMKSSTQGSRSGASTMYFPVFDPEVEDLVALKNPLTPVAVRVRESDYALSINKPFLKRAFTKKPFYLFSYKDNPELYEKFYHADSEVFDEELEAFHMAHPEKTKEVSADELLSTALEHRVETGRLYIHFADTSNKQTPYKDTIYSSNLCAEIALPTKPFTTHLDLYSEDPEGRVAFCNLAGLNIPHIKNDEEYERAAYYALLLIEMGIENTTLPFPALNANLKDWRSAGVGVVGLAYLMAKKGMSYTTQEGREFIHEQAEKYGYFVTKAAIKLTQELGLSKMSSETKYAEGWLPMDDASPSAKALVTRELAYDWDALREEIKALGGLRYSTLFAIAPSESSSIACGLTNSIYPARDLTLTKTAGDSANRWVAPEATRLADKYESAWEIPNEHHVINYALWQIFMDQGISGDMYLDRTKTVDVSMSSLYKELALCAKLGVKTLYYVNTLTDKKETFEFLQGLKEDETQQQPEEQGCDSGGCTL